MAILTKCLCHAIDVTAGIMFLQKSFTNTTAFTISFGFCLTDQFCQRLLQLRPGPHRYSKEPLQTAGTRFFIGRDQINSVKELKEQIYHL